MQKYFNIKNLTLTEYFFVLIIRPILQWPLTNTAFGRSAAAMHNSSTQFLDAYQKPINTNKALDNNTKLPLKQKLPPYPKIKTSQLQKQKNWASSYRKQIKKK